MAIEGKIASILNERDVVINKGSDDGITEGMRFKVNDPAVKISDPDTGDELGTMRREKIRVKVMELQPRFSIAKTYETYTAPMSSVATQVADAFRSRMVTRVRKIILEPPDQKTVTIDVTGSTVNIGDPVVQITA